MPNQENPSFGRMLENKEHSPSKEKLTAASVVEIINPENKILLMKRFNNGDGYGDFWVCPGGKSDPGEAPVDTAIREVYEEVGIRLDKNRNKLFPFKTYITSRNANGKRHNLTIFMASYNADQTPPYRASSREVAGLGWFDPQEAIDKARCGEIKILPAGIDALQRLKEYLSGEHTKKYAQVLTGGTFDRLHSGHKALLEKAFAVGDYVYIGITSDEYIARSNKLFKDKIKSFDERRCVLRNYLREKYILRRAIILPLEDSYPKALDPKLGALVVSEETLDSGVRFINSIQHQLETSSMDTIVIPMKRDETGKIISSTLLRKDEEFQTT